MKKKSLKLLIITICIIAVYIASAFFTLGTFQTPSENYAWKTDGNPENIEGQNSYANIDIKNDQKYISEIYVFIGAVETFSTDSKGNEYVLINFDFKTKSATTGSSQFYDDRKEVKVPVVYGSGGYKYVKVYDSEDFISANGTIKKGEISYQRVKINTPHCFDFHEVIFTDVDGNVLGVEVNMTDENEKIRANLLIDEQETFKVSDAKKYNLTDKELENLYAVKGFMNGEATVVTKGPLTTFITYLGVSIFGENTFGVRFFDFVTGFGILVLCYAFGLKLFGNKKYGIFASLFALTLGAVYSASTLGFGLYGVFFALLAFYFATRYFISGYNGENGFKSLLDLIYSGVFFSLAIAMDISFAVAVVGLIVLYAFARVRAKKEYKRIEKEAVGLEKEEVFLANRKNVWMSFLTVIISFVVMPIVIFTLAFAIVSKSYTAYFNSGFIASAVKYTKNALTPVYEVNPFKLFVGFGGQNFNGYYSFLNYVTAILGLLSFIFVTVAVFFGKKIEFLKNVPSIKNKYKIITTAFLTFALTVFLGYESSVCGFVGTSIFYALYIVFAEYILYRSINKRIVKVGFNVAVALTVVSFAMAFVGLAGITVPEIVSKILYLWQVL